MKENSPKEEEEDLFEQFTIQGFFAVCIWSFLYWVSSLGLLKLFESMGWWDIKFNLKSAAVLYLILWVFVFLTACLIPKLMGNK